MIKKLKLLGTDDTANSKQENLGDRGHVIIKVNIKNSKEFSLHYYTNEKKHYANLEIDQPGIIKVSDIDRILHIMPNVDKTIKTQEEYNSYLDKWKETLNESYDSSKIFEPQEAEFSSQSRSKYHFLQKIKINSLKIISFGHKRVNLTLANYFNIRFLKF